MTPWQQRDWRRNVLVHGHPTCLDCASVSIKALGRCDTCYRRAVAS